MRVSVVQLSGDLDAPLTERVAHAADVVRAQAGADLVVLPELWAHGAFAADRWATDAEPLDGPTVTAMRAAVRDAGVLTHIGSVMERDDQGRLHNTAVLVGPDGEVREVYRKVHLFGFAEGEAALLTAGDDVVVHDGWLGLATCYDLRFPELFRALVDKGATVVVLSSSWPVARMAHWRVLTRARAIEDQVVLVACNAVGTNGGVALGGESVVLDPWGEVLGEAASGTEAVLTVDVDVDEVAKVRERFPVLANRRLR
jgi:predicted amidohydrolase